MEDPAKKQCPQCGETILAIAVKCKHCQSDLTPEGRARALASIRPNGTLGIIALMIPLAAIALCWLWIANMPLIMNPWDKFQGVVIVAIVGSSFIVALEASHIGMGQAKNESGPIAWFVACLLMWIICFPLYFHSRAKRGATNMAIAAILVTAVFIGSSFIFGIGLQHAIQQAAADVQRSIDAYKAAFGVP